jgi:hypothetical protein
MADPSLFQNYMNSRTFQAPAFTYEPGVGFKPTEQSQQIVDLLQNKSGKKFNLQPANSVMAIEGSPMWGTGGGVVWNDSPSTGIVDPLQGTAHVVAHEGGHAVFPSKLKKFSQSPGFGSTNPLSVPRETGQRMRYVHEIFSKPKLEEEARAQGIAYGTLKQLGIPSEEVYETPIDYPRSYLSEGLGLYGKTEIGPPTMQETKEKDAILKGTEAFLQRIFKQGQQLMR